MSRVGCPVRSRRTRAFPGQPPSEPGVHRFGAPGSPAIYAACATGFAWIQSWHGAQTMSVLRRIFVMRAAHAGCPGSGFPRSASLAAICRLKFFGEEREALAWIYPTAEDGRITTAIIDAARRVRDLNFRYLREGKGAPVSARFGDDGITIIDPNRIDEGSSAVFQKVYSRPI